MTHVEGRVWARAGKSGKTYYYRRTGKLFDNGKVLDKRVGLGPNLERAMARARELEVQFEAELRGETVRRDMLLSEYVAWYIGHVRDERKLAAAENIVPTVQGFLRHCGDRPLSRVRRADIEGYLIARKATLKPSTVNALRKDLKRMFQVAVEREHLKANPVDGIRPLPAPRAPVWVPMPEQVERLLAYVKGRYPWMYPLAVFMLGTGCRSAEALGLDWAAVSIPESRVTLTRHKVGDQLALPLVGLLKVTLENHWMNCGMPVKGPAFTGPDGEAIEVYQLYGYFKRAAKATGLERATPRTLRRLAATVAAAGGDIRAAQQVLGHTSFRTTELYLGGGEEAKNRGMGAVASYLGGLSGTNRGTNDSERAPALKEVKR